MRFKLDENLHPDGAAVLREAGHDVQTVWDQGLQGAPDPRIAAVVQAERRVFVTFDVGFADIRAHPPAAFAGLIVLRLQHQDRHSLVRVITRILGELAKRAVSGRLWVVDERRIRIRGAEP